MDKRAKDFEKGWEDYKAKRMQEQEEMIGLIQGAVGGCATHWASLIAEELLKYYQPKIPEGAVVITREEYEILVKTAQGKIGNMKSNDFLKACISSGVMVEAVSTEDEKSKEVNDLVKEKLKKFAERLKEKAGKKSMTYRRDEIAVLYSIFDIEIDEIAKELIGEK